MCQTLKGDVKIKRKLGASIHKSENLHFDGFLLSKAHKVLGEKVQKSYVS